MSKTVCFDFDGVFHSYKRGWLGSDNIPDPPVELDQMKKELTKLKYELEFDIVIFSTRCYLIEGKTAIWEWLEKYELDGFINDITHEKPVACAYVDDRGITFDGHWSGLADKINEFENWIEKDVRRKELEVERDEERFLINSIKSYAKEGFYYGGIPQSNLIRLLVKLNAGNDVIKEILES